MWSIGPLQSDEDTQSDFYGVGFVLFDEYGNPCLRFGYRTSNDAMLGKKALQALLERAARLSVP